MTFTYFKDGSFNDPILFIRDVLSSFQFRILINNIIISGLFWWYCVIPLNIIIDAQSLVFWINICFPLIIWICGTRKMPRSIINDSSVFLRFCVCCSHVFDSECRISYFPLWCIIIAKQSKIPVHMFKNQKTYHEYESKCRIEIIHITVFCFGLWQGWYRFCWWYLWQWL